MLARAAAQEYRLCLVSLSLDLLQRRLGLTAAQNWVLFYALLTTHLEEMFPVIYTPTEADAIANYSHLFRRSEGLYLSPPLLDTMEEDFLDALRVHQPTDAPGLQCPE
jgi:malic enzyme